MASVATLQNGYGRLGEVVRGLLNRLAPLEATSEEHSEEIDLLKEKAQTVHGQLETLKKITDLQDSEVADHDRRLVELQKEIEFLKNGVAAQEATIKRMSKELHGAKVKTGLAKAAAARAEESLAKTRARKAAKRTPA